MARATYNRINSEIYKHGIQIVKGCGYHYFADLDDATTFNADKIPSVFDGGFLSCMNLEGWLSYVEDALQDAR